VTGITGEVDMTVSRLLDGDADELLALVRHVADAELAPFAVKSEEAHEFPRDRIRTLGAAGLLGMPFPESVGGGGVPYEVCLQLLEGDRAALAHTRTRDVGAHAVVHAAAPARRRQRPGVAAGSARW